MTLNPMTRKQRIANALPGEERQRRKFDGKWYALKGVKYSRQEAEALAKQWREGRVSPPQYVRIVHVPEGGPLMYDKWLLYARSRPLTQKERVEERRYRSIPSRKKEAITEFFFSGHGPVTKYGRKAGKR